MGALVTLKHLGVANVPGLVGRPVLEACQLLQDAGLQCVQVDRGSATGTGQPPGVVVARDPGGGTTALPAARCGSSSTPV